MLICVGDINDSRNTVAAVFGTKCLQSQILILITVITLHLTHTETIVHFMVAGNKINWVHNEMNLKIF